MRAYRGFVPSVGGLVLVGVFWIVGLSKGLTFLFGHSSMFGMLTGLYLMLALVALSLIIGVLAVNDLIERTRHHTSH